MAMYATLRSVWTSMAHPCMKHLEQPATNCAACRWNKNRRAVPKWIIALGARTDAIDITAEWFASGCRPPSVQIWKGNSLWSRNVSVRPLPSPLRVSFARIAACGELRDWLLTAISCWAIVWAPFFDILLICSWSIPRSMGQRTVSSIFRCYLNVGHVHCESYPEREARSINRSSQQLITLRLCACFLYFAIDDSEKARRHGMKAIPGSKRTGTLPAPYSRLPSTSKRLLGCKHLQAGLVPVRTQKAQTRLKPKNAKAIPPWFLLMLFTSPIVIHSLMSGDKCTHRWPPKVEVMLLPNDRLRRMHRSKIAMKNADKLHQELFFMRPGSNSSK